MKLRLTGLCLFLGFTNLSQASTTAKVRLGDALPGPSAYELSAAPTEDVPRAAAAVPSSTSRPARWLAPGGSILIDGITVEGSQSQRFLVRAIGPSLTQFGVSGALSDPFITVFNGSGAAVASNDNWSSDAQNVAAAASQSGAFALADGSRDAALVLTLPPGGYTIQVSGVNGTTGVALAEVYALP